MAIRNAAKAIIINDGKILLNKCLSNEKEIYYDLPGGGQNQYETMEEAVLREVLEETGYKVKIVKFVALCEEIYDDKELRVKYPDYTHRVFHIFLAEVEEKDASIDKLEMDKDQVESIWVSFEEADVLNVRPLNIYGRFTQILNSQWPQYLGCIRMG